MAYAFGGREMFPGKGSVAGDSTRVKKTREYPVIKKQYVSYLFAATPNPRTEKIKNITKKIVAGETEDTVPPRVLPSAGMSDTSGQQTWPDKTPDIFIRPRGWIQESQQVFFCPVQFHEEAPSAAKLVPEVNTATDSFFPPSRIFAYRIEAKTS